MAAPHCAKRVNAARHWLFALRKLGCKFAELTGLAREEERDAARNFGDLWVGVLLTLFFKELLPARLDVPPRSLGDALDAIPVIQVSPANECCAIGVQLV